MKEGCVIFILSSVTRFLARKTVILTGRIRRRDSLLVGSLYSRQAPPQENALRVGADKLAPEIYLDGEIIDNDDLQSINPSEIKSISVDKSTPNGRVTINTK